MKFWYTQVTSVSVGINYLGIYLRGKSHFNTNQPFRVPERKVEENRMAFFGQFGLIGSLGGQIQIYKYTNTYYKYSFGQTCR